ncbi:hypothetical protein II810_04350 [bacterium]|nr:hypothetical protein [bacterium]
MENYIKENGLEELYNSDDMKEEQKREFIAHFNKPLEQRVQERLYKNKNMIYEVLNFTQDEIKSINDNPDTLKEICEKYGFAY